MEGVREGGCEVMMEGVSEGGGCEVMMEEGLLLSRGTVCLACNVSRCVCMCVVWTDVRTHS